jgi:hypothetical protein
VLHFNSTFLGFEVVGWGPNQDLMTNLDLPYKINILGAGAASDAIRSLLDVGVPLFFYLWSPHAFNSRYNLSRIELPPYVPARFGSGLTDFPPDVLEKVGAKSLNDLSDVAQFYRNVRLDNFAQESMLLAMDSGMPAFKATCDWMTTEENRPKWEAWIPPKSESVDHGEPAAAAGALRTSASHRRTASAKPDLRPIEQRTRAAHHATHHTPVRRGKAARRTCDSGHYVRDNTSCEPCAEGSGSVNQTATVCVLCAPGMCTLPFVT